MGAIISTDGVSPFEPFTRFFNRLWYKDTVPENYTRHYKLIDQYSLPV